MPYPKLQEMVGQSQRIVFFGGAGVSTESGIPDFRSADGVFSGEHNYPPEFIVSRPFFEADPLAFYRFYKAQMIHQSARPNAAHKKLFELEQNGKLLAVITQNIDGLHQMAGSKNVLELHGSIHRNYCVDCRADYSLDFILQADGVPRCTRCGGLVRPDVVLYEEYLDEGVLQGAARAIEQADMLIVGGTSLLVYPAAGLLRHYEGNRLVLINRSETSSDEKADLLIRGSIGEVLLTVKA